MEEDEEKELFSQWGEEDEKDVAWFMKRIRKSRTKMEEEAAQDNQGGNGADGDS